MLLEPPPFRSLEEAQDFLANHEIATCNKYVTKTTKNINQSLALATLDSRRIRFDFLFENRTHCDGIPFVMIGIKTTCCQYGIDYKQQSKYKYTPAGFKQKRRGHSKKVNCPAKSKMSLIMKFPEYALPPGDEHSDSERRKMSFKLRQEFCEDTQRYLLVYLKIDAHHEHGIESIIMNNLTNKEVSRSLLRNASVTTLKNGATLKGKNMSGLITQFAYTTELQFCLAQPNLSQSLDQMGINELLALYCELTGDTPNSVFTSAQREFNEENLRLLVHLCIVFANAEFENSTQRVAHQSVRVSGTENSFTPVTCFDTTCPAAGEEVHMHCPFCPKNEYFTDPSSLRLHYNERHVGKALELGGLTFLRCLGECATKDAVKDIKIYLQGHWHCCKCLKLFNKRCGFERHVQNHITDSTSSSVLLDKNFYTTPNPHTIKHDLKLSKNPTEVGAESSTSHYPSVTDIEPEVYKVTSCPTTRNTVETSYTFTDTTEELLGPEYDRAVLYIQGENNQIVYTSDPHDNANEVVIHMSESETEHLHQRLRELEHKCMELEHENMAYKSHIEFLNKKIEELTLTRQAVREITPEVSNEMEITECSVVEQSQIEDETDATKENSVSYAETPTKNNKASTSDVATKNSTSVNDDKTKVALLQSLEQLRATHQIKDEPIDTTDSIVVKDEDVSEITDGLRKIKTEVEQLKMAYMIGNQIKHELASAAYIPNSNPVFFGNFGLTIPTIIPQNVILNPNVSSETSVSNDKCTTSPNLKRNATQEEVDKDKGETKSNAAEKDTSSDKTSDDKNIKMSENDTAFVPPSSEQSNVMIPIGVAPTGKIVTYLHMPTQTVLLGTPTNTNEGTSDKNTDEDSSGEQSEETGTSSLDTSDTMSPNKGVSPVVLAVVNDTVKGGKKVVSLVQVSEDEATLSIPFEYKCFQKEKVVKDDGTCSEVKKEIVKNQIKLKVKGKVKALQGDALQKIVDSALSRFVVIKPPPNKKQKVK